MGHIVYQKRQKTNDVPFISSISLGGDEALNVGEEGGGEELVTTVFCILFDILRAVGILTVMSVLW